MMAATYLVLPPMMTCCADSLSGKSLTMLPQTRFSKTNLTVTRIALGGYPFGGVKKARDWAFLGLRWKNRGQRNH